MNKARILKQVNTEVRRRMEGEATGHDWWHVVRVRETAKKIGKKEKANLFTVELGALLHDIADFKFHSGDDKIGPKVARDILNKAAADDDTINAVLHIVAEVSFKGANVKNRMESLEGKVVQDADRLDGLGAIGIARAFAYGGSKNRPIYEPSGKVRLHKSFEEYKKYPAESTIHHFYEKLFLVKDRLNTKTAKQIAKQRHKFMENYLKQFYKEWSGK